MTLIHASCVAINNKAVLLAGPSGSGKSDLALRLIDEGAVLVADDHTELKIKNGALIASPPENIKGLIEVRHVGLMKLDYAGDIPVALYIDLVAMEQKLERLPEDDQITLLDVSVRRLVLPAFAASTPAKIQLILKGYPQN